MLDELLTVFIIIMLIWAICTYVQGPNMCCRAGFVTNYHSLRGNERQRANRYILNSIKRSGLTNAEEIEDEFLQRLYGPTWKADPEPVQLTDPNKPKPYNLIETVYGDVPFYMYEWRDIRYGPEWGPTYNPHIMNSKTWFQKTMRLREAEFWKEEMEREGKLSKDIKEVLENEVYRQPVTI